MIMVQSNIQVKYISSAYVLKFGLFQVDLEEAKGQEITKLQNALHEMQEQLEEARAAVIHEREAAKIAIEQAPPVIKEVPVVDNTKLEQLTNQNQELEVKLINLPHVWYNMS